MDNSVLTKESLQKALSLFEAELSEPVLTGDDYIRMFIAGIIVHPADKERMEGDLDMVFGKRWRTL